MEEVAAAVAEVAAGRLRNQLFEHGVSSDAAVVVAADRWLDDALARQLLAHPSDDVRAALADNPACPPDLLVLLSDDPDPFVSGAALDNSACPYPTYAAAGRNPLHHDGCPPEHISRVLEADPQLVWRDPAVASHPNLGRPWIVRSLDLARPLSAAVTMLPNPKLTQAEAGDIIAASTADRSAVATLGADDGDWDFSTWSWAENPAADPAWLAETADRYGPVDDPREGERRRQRTVRGLLMFICGNPSTTPETLTAVADSGWLPPTALDHPRCPPSVMHKALDQAPDRGPFSSHRHLSLAAVTSNRSTPVDVLDRVHLATRRADPWYDVALAHATGADHARTLLSLAPTWTGTVGHLVRAAGLINTPTAGSDQVRPAPIGRLP